MELNQSNFCITKDGVTSYDKLLEEIKILQNEVDKLKNPYDIDEFSEKEKNIQTRVANILEKLWIKQQNELKKLRELEDESLHDKYNEYSNYMKNIESIAEEFDFDINLTDEKILDIIEKEYERRKNNNELKVFYEHDNIQKPTITLVARSPKVL